jgi:TolB protein
MSRFSIKQLLGLVFTGVCAMSAVTATPQQNTRPFYSELSWSADGSRIMFSAFEGKNADIYVMRADGSQLARLTDNPAVDMWGSFSPDGRRIAFQSDRDGQPEIYVMNADGSDVKRMTRASGRSIGPAWSPDGSRIIFSSDRGKGLHLYVMSADGSDQAMLIKEPAEATTYYNPIWSPDGKKVVFYSEKGDNKDQIWVVRTDGTNLKLLTNNVGHNVYPSWSRDGRKILFTADRGEVRGGIYVMNADGSNLTRVGSMTASMARWSPDGKKIAFIAGDYPVSDINVMNADGSGAVKLTR